MPLLPLLYRTFCAGPSKPRPRLVALALKPHPARPASQLSKPPKSSQPPYRLFEKSIPMSFLSATVRCWTFSM